MSRTVENYCFQCNQCYASLERFCIRCSFNSLVSFPLELFPKLNHLDIHGCQNLHSFSFSNRGPLQHLLSLKSLKITKCFNFVSLSKEELHAPNLTWFCVYNCNYLKVLPDQMHKLFPSLQTLRIQCSELESFLGGFLSSLNSLDIRSCDKLIVGSMGWRLKGLHPLRSFYISDE